MQFTIIHKTIPQPVLLPPTYGVWIPGKGWLNPDPHGDPAKAYTDTNRRVVASVARRVGGRVEFIDKSLVDLEDKFLKVEFNRKQRKIVGRMGRWLGSLKEKYHVISRRHHKTTATH